MKRYVDPLFFTTLFAIDVIVWVFAALAGSVPPAVVVMAPAFFSLAIFALGRALLNIESKRFYLFVAIAAGVFALSLWVTQMLTPPLELFDFSTGAWVLVVCGLGSLLGLFLGAVGAIPSPARVKLDKALADAKRTEEKEKQKAQQQAQKAEQRAQKAQARAARSNKKDDANQGGPAEG